MIFRAIFWIGLVSLLTPHEPDLGLGRPGAGISLPAFASSGAVIGLSRPGAACKGASEACAGGLGPLAALPFNPASFIDPVRLAAVRAEIDDSIKARAAAR